MLITISYFRTKMSTFLEFVGGFRELFYWKVWLPTNWGRIQCFLVREHGGVLAAAESALWSCLCQ